MCLVSSPSLSPSMFTINLCYLTIRPSYFLHNCNPFYNYVCCLHFGQWLCMLLMYKWSLAFIWDVTHWLSSRHILWKFSAHWGRRILCATWMFNRSKMLTHLCKWRMKMVLDNIAHWIILCAFLGVCAWIFNHTIQNWVQLLSFELGISLTEF